VEALLVERFDVCEYSIENWHAQMRPAPSKCVVYAENIRHGQHVAILGFVATVAELVRNGPDLLHLTVQRPIDSGSHYVFPTLSFARREFIEVLTPAEYIARETAYRADPQWPSDDMRQAYRDRLVRKTYVGQAVTAKDVSGPVKIELGPTTVESIQDVIAKAGAEYVPSPSGDVRIYIRTKGRIDQRLATLDQIRTRMPPEVEVVEAPPDFFRDSVFNSTGPAVWALPAVAANSRHTRNRDGSSWKVIDSTADTVTAVCGSNYETFHRNYWSLNFMPADPAPTHTPVVTGLERAIREEADWLPNGISPREWRRELLAIADGAASMVHPESAREAEIDVRRWAQSRRAERSVGLALATPKYGRAAPPSDEERARWRAEDDERAKRVRAETVAAMRKGGGR
jgi:hypothetical protein